MKKLYNCLHLKWVSLFFIFFLAINSSFGQAFTENFNTNSGETSSLTKTLSGVQFDFVFTADNGGGIMRWESGFGDGNSASVNLESYVYNTGTTEKVTIKRQDGNTFIFSGIFINNDGGQTITVQGYNGVNTVGSPQTVGNGGEATLNFPNITVTEVRLTSTDFINSNIDTFRGEVVSNSPPTASSFTASNGPFENLTHTFSTANFGYSDSDGNPLSHVLIESLPSAGTLYLDGNGNDAFDSGEGVSINSIISKANLDAGNLQYIQNGSTNTSFQFEVNDGTASSSGNYMANLNVSPVPTVTLSVTPMSKFESVATNSEIKATISNTYGAPVIVNLGFTGTATGSGVDYSVTGTSITINPGNTSGTRFIANVPDAFYEGNEYVDIDITSVTNGFESGVQKVTYTIIDDDSPPTATLEVLDRYNPITDESGGQAYVRAKIDELAGVTVNVPLSFSGTATGGGTDYAVTGTTISIYPGQTMDSIRVTSLYDNIEEGNETIIIDMGTPTNGQKGSPNQVTITIIDEDLEAPKDYTVAINQDPITPSNSSNISFTFADAEIGTTYNYLFTSSAGGSTISGSGTITSINQTISNIDLSGMTDGTITLSVTLTDGIGNEGSPTTDTAIKQSNFPPIATAPSTPTVIEDTPANLDVDIEVTDVEGDDQTVTFTITGGTLTIGTTDIVFGGSLNGSNSFTASGSLSAINTALDEAVFVPDLNLAGTGVATISFVSNDGSADSNTATVIFDIAAVNDDPYFTGLPTSITVEEDEYPMYFRNAISGGSFGDVDSGAGLVTFKMTASDGLIGIANPVGYGLTYTGHNTSTMTLTGAASDIETFLNINTNILLDLPDNLNGNNAITISLSANDDGNTGTGGGTDVSLGSFNININPVNDPPTFDGLPTDISVQDGIASNIDLSSATFGDVDSGSGNVRLSFLVSVGDLTATGGNGVTVTSPTAGALDLEGTASDIEDFLNSPSNIHYTNATGATGDNAATLSISANDLGNSGSGGGTSVSFGSINIDVREIPSVTSVSVPANGTYSATQNLDFTVNYSEAVTVSGAPSFEVTIGSTVYEAEYVSGSGSAALLFRYTVQPGDLDANGIAVGGIISLNGGSIQNSFAVDAELNLNSVGSTAAVLVDGIAPSVIRIERQNPTSTPTNADAVTFRVTFAEGVSRLDASDFEITGPTGSSIGVSGSGSTYDVTVSGGNMASLNGVVTLNFAAGQNITDLAGNALTNTLPTETNDNEYLLDNIAPTVSTISPADNTTDVSLSSDFVITFSEDVVVNTGNLTVHRVSDDGVVRTIDVTNSSLVSIAGTVVTFDNTSDLALGTEYYILLGNGAFQDEAGNVFVGIADPSAWSFTTSVQTQISINDPSVTEGNSGSGDLTFTVSLSQPAPAGGATVDYATSNGLAIAGSDYTAASGTLSFAAGESSKTVNVGISGDEVVEPDETFTLTLSNPTGINVAIGDGSSTGTILNDDSASLTIADVSVNESDGIATISVTLDNAVQGGFTVDASTADGTATTADADYSSVITTLIFTGTAGEVQTFQVPITDDSKVEIDETLSISLNDLASITLNVDITDAATLTISNDDQASVTIADVSGNEDDGAITVTATLDIAVVGGFTLNASTADGTATTADSDYTAVSAQTLTFAGTPGETQTIAVVPTSDGNVEPNETVQVSMSGLVPSIVSASDINITDGATVTIVNDDLDAPSTPDLAASSDSGMSDTDNITNDLTPTFTGTALANSTVTIISDLDGSLGTTTADGLGNWTFTSGSNVSTGIHSITAIATDLANNDSPVSNALSVTFDVQAPSPILVADLTLQLDINGLSPSITPGDLLAIQISDDYSASADILLSLDETSFDCSKVGSNSVIVTATDEAGNSGSEDTNVLVQDLIGPTIQAKSSITLNVDAFGTVSLTPSMIEEGSTDACGIQTRVLSQTLFDRNDEGVKNITYTVTDVNGNSSQLNVAVTIVLVPKVLTIIADAGQNKVYGDPDPIFTYTATGFESGDNESILSGALSRDSGEDVGTYAITLGTLDAGPNYTINFTPSDFEISPAPITGITFDDNNFVYDGTAKSLAITGTVPTGARVSYSNNSRTDVGSQEVTATISGSNFTTLALTAELTITPATITGITFSDNNFVYDGTAKSLVIGGTLPAGTSVSYADNSRTDVGSQEVTATISGSNFTTLVLTAELTITPATITGITFSDNNFVYDGTAKSLVIGGTLPAGTSVSYADNSRTDVGSQEVTATISGSNFTTLVLTADLTVTPATITGITFSDNSFVYDGTAKSLAITGTVPTGATVSYSNNSRTDVGTQEVTVTISGANFTTLVLTADLTITPATTTGITFDDGSFVYDGTAKSLAITGTVPTGATVSYSNNSRTDVGTQEVVVTISGANFTTLVLTADLTVTPATIMGITFDDGSFVYDGTAKSLAIGGTLPVGTAVIYSNNSRTDVGTQEVTATISGSNFTTLVLTADLTVTPATITGITFDNDSFVYDGTAKSLAIVGTLPAGAIVSYADNSKTDVGSQEVTATISGSNYTTLVLTADLTVTPTTISGITFDDDSFVYDGTAKSLAIGGTVPVGASVTYLNNSRTDVGTQEVTATISGSNFTTLVLTADLTVTPATISEITFDDDSFVYDGTAKSLAIGGTLPVGTSVSYSNNSRTDVGTQEVTATISGSNFTTLVLTADLTVTPATISEITFDDDSFVYDGTAKSLAIGGTLPAGTSVAYTNNGRTDVGTQQVTATISGSNFTTLVLTADLTVTPGAITGITFDDDSFVYDGTAKSLAIGGTLPAGTSVAYTNNGRTDVGTQQVTATISGSNFTTLVLTADLTVTPGAITGITFDDDSFVYDGTAKSLAITGTLPTGTTVTYSNNSRTDVGTQEVTATISGSNFTTLVLTADLTVNPATLDINVDAGQTKVYGDADLIYTFTATGFEGGDDEMILTGALTRVAGEDVGTYAIQLGTLDIGPNYSINFTPADFEITPATLDITSDAGQSKVYGDADPVLTYQYSGLKNGDTNAVITGVIARKPGEDVGTFAINLGTLYAGPNYTINFTPADFEITSATLDITADAGQKKVYGNADPVFSYQVAGLKNGDTEGAVITGALTRVVGEDVGLYAIQPGTIDAGSNYTINFTSADFEITPANFDIIADAGQTKVYGNADPEFTYQVNGYQNGDDASILTGALVRAAGEDVGTYAINLGTLSAGSNYNITYTGADFTITPRTLSIKANPNQVKVFGSADPVFAYTASNFGNGDNVSILTGALSRVPGENVGMYAFTLGTLNAGANYTINFTSADFEIAEKVLNVTADSGQGKVFGTVDPVLTYQVTGFENGDNASILTGVLARAVGENVGSYAINLGSLDAGANYAINYTGANFTITKATITGITFANGTFVYDGTEKSLEISGVLPAGTSVAYTNNSRTDVGTQESIARISGSNYNTLVLTADLTITPAEIGAITFADGSFVYDGTEKSLAISGTLPDGTSVSYTNNGRTDVGTQEVTATINGSNFNEVILTADLSITPSTLMVTADDGQGKVFGTMDPPLIYEASGFKGMDTEAILTGSLSRESGEDIGSYEITQGNLSAGMNYTIDFTGADFVIIEEPNKDQDGDGVPDEVEEEQGTDPTDPMDYQDEDGDVVPDYVEEQQGTDPTNPGDYLDSDGDDVPDYVEDQQGTDPNDGDDYQDVDGDGIPDYVNDRSISEFIIQEIEVLWGTPESDLKTPTEVVAMTAIGEIINLPVVWDLGGYNALMAGTGNYNGTVEVPDGLFNPDELTPILQITVLAKPAPTDVTLSANSFIAIPDVFFQEIGVFTVIDPTDDVHTLTLPEGVQDNEYFEVIDGILFWSSAEQAQGRTDFNILLRVEDRGGNVIEKSFQITRQRTSLDQLDVPNTFTPNGDGANDTWGVPALRYYQGVRISIMEVGGNRVFYTENPDIRWDGTFDGKELPVGAYFWIIEVAETGEVRRGVLNLLRQ
ncbi:gliding motility-associated-like protein [Algoriphagus iocasae]|uniref:Gliding motility-associated-like protein n=1 Tax=Algoriphagus iocasae TaxID=1836499 RepID=A0A841MTW4_9BACT|nr:MBG domain-containing protein [Algoriphagus iocasae]MBB6328997.1 gliding motility-associated-like protein [Algoriphagus iocasae]